MYWNLYAKRILISLRDRDSIIWTLIFPLLLATLFYATFGSLDTVGQFKRFPLGVVNDEAHRVSGQFEKALESVSDADGMFELSFFAGTREADEALAGGAIEGYILPGEPHSLVVAGDGINQTIAKGFLDRYIQTEDHVLRILAADPSRAENLPGLLQPVSFTAEISLASNPPTEKVGYFYALLAMLCMYGAFQGLTTVTYLQANLSPLGARRTLSPAPRWCATALDLLGGITVHFLCLLSVVAYIIFVLKTNFGDKLGLVLLTCLAGSMLGVAFGAQISVVSKLKEQAKVAIVITFTMVCSFLSGLMISGINYTIAQKAPPVSWLNPAARIADAFYCLYYYDTYERYFLNIGIILAMTSLMFIGTALFLRRQRYESI